MIAVGHSVLRKEAFDKVTDAAKYTNDHIVPGMLHACLVTSTHAHAKLTSVDASEALEVPGVRAVVTGADTNVLTGEVLEDRPPLAREKVRYYGEPVAVVVADTEAEAMRGAEKVKITYDPLPVVNYPREALKEGAPLVHENLGQYKQAQEPVYPKAGTNQADHARIRKGDMDAGWQKSDIVIEFPFSMPQLDHAAMETRCAIAQILPS